MNTRNVYALLFTLLILAPAQAQPAPTLETYTDSGLGFKMQYISSFKPQKGDKAWIAVQFVPVDESKQTMAAVGVPDLPDRKQGEPKLDDVAQRLVSVLSSDVPDAKVVVASDTKLGGEPARRMILTGHSKRTSTEMKMLITACIHNDRAYVVGISAPKDEWERAKNGLDQLIDTFEFIEKK